MNNNWPLHQKSLELGIKIAQYTNQLKELKHYEIASQFLRSGTSIWANIHESIGSESRKDFRHKLQISLKECHETLFWWDILEQWFNEDIIEIRNLCLERKKMLISTIKTLKSQL